MLDLLYICRRGVIRIEVIVLRTCKELNKVSIKHVIPLLMHRNAAARTEHLLHFLLLAMYELTHVCVHVHVRVW